ncbi:T6SS phospholipase effector Tle1-like catalytic domain-containing protein [Litorilituus sediminis]|uniref:DUF2235 domain-containing protein n=1 Tax=Litorilituus sediminis TaxID=718192 RepID=A0A4P6P412_9GAMM|nr:DUF2235 domain-containing protein [Litorilituus sediminis]QBG35618.1 DUF2235 domain-containing protein [Litorilituus sediminis]
MNKLIFCFDGTYNEPEDVKDFCSDSSITNIAKLHVLLGGSFKPLNAKNNQGLKQHSFYYSGVGTHGNWLTNLFNALFAPSFGDLEDILSQANSDFQRNYQAGDEIYIFGFSRGAAIARIFAAKLKYPVKFLGVFDTVAATAATLDLDADTLPVSDIVFENDVLAGHIEQAVHLVALDEKRIAFQPTLFNRDSRVLEVWFAGSHSDIGGGYWHNGLSDITLNFMLSQVKPHLAILTKDTIDYSRLVIAEQESAIGPDDVYIKAMVDGVLHQKHRTNKLAKTLAPRKVRVNVNEQPSSFAPLVHWTVAKRFTQLAEYRPYALRNVNYSLLLNSGAVQAQLFGVYGLDSYTD